MANSETFRFTVANSLNQDEKNSKFILKTESDAFSGKILNKDKNMPVEKSNSPSSRHKNKKLSYKLLPNNNSSSSSAQKRTIYNYLVESDNLRRQQENLLKDKLELKKEDSYDIHIQENDLISNQLKINSYGLKYANIPSNPARPKKRGRMSTCMQRKKKLQTHSQKIEGITRNPKRSGRPPSMHNNQEISVPSSFSYLKNQNRYSINQANILGYINDLFSNKTKQQIGQIFSTNSLFHSSSSLLTKLDIKALFQSKLFETLTRQSQLKLIKLLPECDRQLDPQGSFKLSSGALNNEFIKKCCVEWQNKLISGEFGNFNYNQYLSSGSCYDNYENSLLNKSTTITRSTRLKQERILQNLRDLNQSSEEEFLFYDEYDGSLDDTIDSKVYQQDQKFHTESEKDSKQSDVQESIKFSKIENFKSSIKVKEEFIYESSKESSICIKSSSDESDIDESSHNRNELISDVLGTSELNLFVNESDQESVGNKTTQTILSDNSSYISLTEEDLEAKRRLLRRKAKRLLKKNKKLRENFKITSDCMIANIKEINQIQNSKSSESFSSQKSDLVVKRSNFTNLPVRKSQRKRQTSRKFNEKDYALNIDDLQSRSTNHLSTNIKNVDLFKKQTKNFKFKINSGDRKSDSNLNVSLEAEQNGDLKLRIKRIISNTSHDTSGVSGVSTILTSLVNSQSTESCSSNKMDFLSDEKTSIESCENISDERRIRRKRQISEYANLANNEYKSVFLYSTGNGEIDIDQDHINQLIMIASSPTNSNQVSNEAPINEEIGNSISKNCTRIKNSSAKTFSFSASCNIFPDVVNLTSPTISPCSSSANAPMTRAAAAKLKQHVLLMPGSPSVLNLISAANQGSTSSLIDAKLLPPPPPLPVPPQDLFNDDENEVDLSLLRNHDSSSELKKSLIIEERLNDTEKKMENTNLKKSIQDENNFRTLAQLKAKIAETKRKSFNDKIIVIKKNKPDDSTESGVVSSIDSYSSNIQKIVHELKSIGSNATHDQEKQEIIPKPSVLRFLCEKEFENDTNHILTDKKKTIIDDFISIIPENNDSYSGKSFYKEKKQKYCENERDLVAKSKLNAKNMKFISNIQDTICKKINKNSNHLSNLDGANINLLCIVHLQKQFEEKCDFVKCKIDTNLIDQPINLEIECFGSNMIADNINDKQSLVELPSINTLFSFLEDNYFSENASTKTHNQESYKSKIESKKNLPQNQKYSKNGNKNTYANELVRNFDGSSILPKDSISESRAISKFSASLIESDKLEIDADFIALQSRISGTEPHLSNHYQSKEMIQNATSNSASMHMHSTLHSMETQQNSNLTLDSFSFPFKQGNNNHQFQNSINQTSQNFHFQPNNYSAYSKYSSPDRSKTNASYQMHQLRSDFQSSNASQIPGNVNLSVSGNIYTQKPLSGLQYQSTQTFQNPQSYNNSSFTASGQSNMGQLQQTTFIQQSTNQNHYQHFQNSLAIDFKSKDSSQCPQNMLIAKNEDIASSQYQQIKVINGSVINSINSQPLLLTESENSDKNLVSMSKTHNDNSSCITQVESTFKTKLNVKNSCGQKKQPKTPDNLDYNVESKINQSSQENVPSSGSPSPYSNSGSGSASITTKVKRSIKEKNNINSGNLSSQSSNPSNNSQIMSNNSQNSNQTQSKSQRTNQHQLTVAQLLSQKHIQQNQNQIELKHGSDSNPELQNTFKQSVNTTTCNHSSNSLRIITSPLTVSTGQQSLQNKLSDVSPEIIPTSNLNSASISSTKIIKINFNQSTAAETADELIDENLSEFAAIEKAEETSKDEPDSEIIKVNPNQKININPALKQNLITNLKSTLNSRQGFQTIQNNGCGSSQVYLKNLTQVSNSVATSSNIGSLTAKNAKLVGNSVSGLIINKKNSISSTNNSKFDNINTNNSLQGSLTANLTVTSNTTIPISSVSHSAKLISSNNLIGNSISNASKLIQKNTSLNQNSIDAKLSSSLDNFRSDVQMDDYGLANFNESDTNFNEKKTNKHTCFNTRPMIECIKCGEFSHSTCLINQNKKDDLTEKICSKCSDQMKMNLDENVS